MHVVVTFPATLFTGAVYACLSCKGSADSRRYSAWCAIAWWAAILSVPRHTLVGTHIVDAEVADPYAAHRSPVTAASGAAARLPVAAGVAVRGARALAADT